MTAAVQHDPASGLVVVPRGPADSGRPGARRGPPGVTRATGTVPVTDGRAPVRRSHGVTFKVTGSPEKWSGPVGVGSDSGRAPDPPPPGARAPAGVGPGRSLPEIRPARPGGRPRSDSQGLRLAGIIRAYDQSRWDDHARTGLSASLPRYPTDIDMMPGSSDHRHVSVQCGTDLVSLSERAGAGDRD
eukprot:681048-Hanusia_phi.AAC.1